MTGTTDDLDIFFGQRIERVREFLASIGRERTVTRGTDPALSEGSEDLLLRHCYQRRETIPERRRR